MRHRLRGLLTDRGIRDDVCVLMRAEGRPANAPVLFATPVTRSLLAAMWGKAVVEYPTLHVVSATHAAALAESGVEVLRVLPSESEEQGVAEERARAVAERAERRQAARRRGKSAAQDGAAPEGTRQAQGRAAAADGGNMGAEEEEDAPAPVGKPEARADADAGGEGVAPGQQPAPAEQDCREAADPSKAGGVEKGP